MLPLEPDPHQSEMQRDDRLHEDEQRRFLHLASKRNNALQVWIKFSELKPHAKKLVTKYGRDYCRDIMKGKRPSDGCRAI